MCYKLFHTSIAKAGKRKQDCFEISEMTLIFQYVLHTETFFGEKKNVYRYT